MASHKTFHMVTADIKNQAASLVLSKAPFNDPNNLLAFIDFVRLLVAEKQGASFVAENGESFLDGILQKYFIQ